MYGAVSPSGKDCTVVKLDTTKSQSETDRYFRPVIFFLAFLGCVVIFNTYMQRGRSSYPSTDYNGIGMLSETTLPNIIFILTDDQGMGDMDLEGGDFENLMPNIRRLNEAGLNLTHYYSASLCTPARASLMTGRYPVTNGMGHGVVMANMPWGLSLQEKILPEYLNEAGYVCHHIGKWHLGHYSKSHLPTARGFNTSLGYYGGYQHPESYLYEWPGCSNDTGCLPDMHRDRLPFPQDGQFNIETFADEAEKIIAQYGIAEEGGDTASLPFFLYLAVPLIHMPVHPDEEVIQKRASDLLHISNAWRRRMAAMAIMLDDFVYRVESAINQAGIMDNTILIVASDNGAQAEGSQMGAGSNYPLRGSKGSLYEGAMRVPAFIYSPILGHNADGTGASSVSSLFHVSDWLPTLVGGAVGRKDLLSPVLQYDGIDQWAWLSDPTTVSSEPRTRLLYNVDTVTGISGIRIGSWKLLVNESEDVGWYTGSVFGMDMCFMAATQSVQLFNLDEDEQERLDLADAFPEVVTMLTNELNTYISTAPSPDYCGVFDEDAITLWFEKNQIEPWIDLGDSASDYECPNSFISSAWCTMVSTDTPLPVMGTGSGQTRQIKVGTKQLPTKDTHLINDNRLK